VVEAAAVAEAVVVLPLQQPVAVVAEALVVLFQCFRIR
jgi:hypothetical protein